MRQFLRIRDAYSRYNNHMSQILLATNNRGKLIEIQSLLANTDLKLVTPADLNLALDVKEDGNTYAENAILKALAFSDAAGMATLADDSGLEVAALDGAPGLYSARYAPGKNPTDADRRAYLLQQLKNHPQPWKAQFRCVIAIAAPGQETETVEGICPGEIIANERGQNGFGYDPIFRVEALGCTMAEVNLTDKNRVSHRALAIQAALPILLKLNA